MDRNKYNRTLVALGGEKVQTDVYRVIDAFNVVDPHIQHAIKKLLAAGLRGHKDTKTDLEDVINSVQKAIIFQEQQ